MGGQIIDATVIQARRPRLTEAEKDTIKSGGVPAEWTPARRAQIDRDGRWTIKHGRKRRSAPGEGPKRRIAIAVPMFGYKNHIGIDRAHGFVRRYTITHAAAHDGGNSARCSIATTPPAAYGPTPPTAPPTIWLSSSGAV